MYPALIALFCFFFRFYIEENRKVAGRSTGICIKKLEGIAPGFKIQSVIFGGISHTRKSYIKNYENYIAPCKLSIRVNGLDIRYYYHLAESSY